MEKLGSFEPGEKGQGENIMQKKKDPTIGELYGKIVSTSEDFDFGERKLAKEPDHPFVRLCKSIYRIAPSLGKGGKFSDENKKAVEFLQWNLSPEEFAGASAIVAYVSFAIAFLLGSLFIFTDLRKLIELIGGNEISGLFYAFAPFLLIASGIVYLFQTYPSSEAKREQTRALTYVPEMMGYMVMSIKLVPNLEKAVEFASSHGKGKIAKDFKDIMWKTQLGFYNSLAEGLDVLAYRWGHYSTEFKRALMRIRASVIENSESKRYALLDDTMSEMLDSIKNKMEQYARDLSQPSTMLFYIGVLLPLLLIIILPVGSTFTGAPLANPIVLFLIYNIIIPLITIIFAYNLIATRPPTYEPPIIPDNYEGLPKPWHAKFSGLTIDVRLVALLIFILGLSVSFMISTQGFPPNFVLGSEGRQACDEGKQIICPDLSKKVALERVGRPESYFNLDETGVLFPEKFNEKKRYMDLTDVEALEQAEEQAKKEVLAEEQLFFSSKENDIAPYILVFGILITFSICVFVLLYYSSIYKRKAQLEIQEMETEFKDSLYVLASRMGENKPVEDAMKHVQDFLPEAKISKRVFGKTLDNIKFMGMPLEQAAFDPNLGSVSKLPSSIIKGAMKMLVDSVQLGSNVAARTMISLSIQLQNAEKVNNNLKVLVADITSTMRTMAMFIAPMVLGITTSLQRIVIVTISSIASSGIAESTVQGSDYLGVSFASAAGFIKPEAIAGIASPTQFIFIVSLYIIELVLIMGYFTTKIEEDNDLLLKINISIFMPIAIIVFVISMIVSNMFVGSI
jgi:hypothetical protein